MTPDESIDSERHQMMPILESVTVIVELNETIQLSGVWWRQNRLFLSQTTSQRGVDSLQRNEQQGTVGWFTVAGIQFDQFDPHVMMSQRADGLKIYY